jgi:hypothetical protein
MMSSAAGDRRRPPASLCGATGVRRRGGLIRGAQSRLRVSHRSRWLSQAVAVRIFNLPWIVYGSMSGPAARLSGQQPQNVLVVLNHCVQAFWFESKQIRNELKVSRPRGSGGSSPHWVIGWHRHTPPQVSLQSDDVDQLVHDANCAGQVVDAWQLVAAAAIESRIASGSLLSAALSIAGVGAITARVVYSGVSSAAGAAGSAAGAVASGAGLAGGPWPAASQAHRPHAIAITTARARMIMVSSSVFDARRLRAHTP